MRYWLWLGAFMAMLSARAEVAIGTYVAGVGRYQTDKIGSTNKFELSPMVSLNHYLHLSDDLYLAPEIGIAWHLKTESEYRKYTAYLLYGLGWRLTTYWVLRFGAGTFYTRVGGSGELVARNNGSGSATFYTPGSTHTSYNFAGSLGLEWYLSEESSLRAEGYVFDMRSKSRRSFSYALAYNYHF